MRNAHLLGMSLASSFDEIGRAFTRLQSVKQQVKANPELLQTPLQKFYSYNYSLNELGETVRTEKLIPAQTLGERLEMVEKEIKALFADA